jgi:ribonuclease P protein component
MGLIVPKFQSSAVARNRLRRRLSEIWRVDVRERQGARDLLVRTRKEAYEASFVDLRTELLRWVEGL